MKTLALIISLFLTHFICLSQDNLETHHIIVKVDNALSDEGNMLIGLHNADTFMKSKALENKKSAIIDGKVQVIFEDIAPGTYAIMVFHDANDNGKMDFDANGRPLESYGMSNNPILYGPPNFTDAKFNMDNKDLEIVIRF